MQNENVMEENKKNFDTSGNILNVKEIFDKEYNLNTKAEPKKEKKKPEKVVLVEDEDMDTIAKWLELARKMTPELLPAFIDHLMNGYEHTYNSYPYALTACSMAVVYAYGKELSGFQASAIALMFPMHFWYYNNRSGIRLINFDDMLYPQYEAKFEKAISKETWNSLRTEAARLIAEAAEEEFPTADQVLEHWKSIADGIVPFGYSVEKDD